ncbi:exported hypothetical protein [Capnocytophaga canimorsus]|nr:exported hypothetical protein [Capnocytophaga canimorsus]
MLFRLLILWICLITTSLHTLGAKAVAMADGMKEWTKVTYAYGKAYSIITDQLGTPTEQHNAEGEEVWLHGLDMNGDILKKYNQYAPYNEQIWIPLLFQGQYYIKSRS